MPSKRKKSKSSRARRRSRAVPLTLVPALAAAVSATACSSNRGPIDPCEPSAYMQAACDSAVANRGYYYGGTWYPHVYPYAAMYYLGRYNTYVAGGGRVRRMSPSVYVPHVSTPAARPGVVRGGFGGIGGGHVSAGS
jgi:hypothetical protein